MALFSRRTPPPARTKYSGMTFNGIPITQIADIPYELQPGGEARFYVTRWQALRVPAISGSRNMLVNAMAGLPLRLYDAAGAVTDSAFLRNPDPNRTRAALWANTVEDLLFDGFSHWRITARKGRLPAAVRHVPFHHIRLSGDGTTYTIIGEDKPVPTGDVIQFEGLHAGILRTGGITPIRDGEALNRTASHFTDSPIPHGWFSAKEGDDPAPEEVSEFLADWENARRRGAYGYVPSFLDLNIANRDPKGMQLQESKEQVAREAVRAIGTPPEALAVSTPGSRTYFNAEQQRQDTITYTLSAYTRPIEERLSMGDVTADGESVRFDFGGFLRADTKTRYETYAIALANGFLTVDEVRELENRPPL